MKPFVLFFILISVNSAANTKTQDLKLSEIQLNHLIMKSTKSLGKYIGACLFPTNACPIPSKKIATAMHKIFDVAKRITKLPIPLWEHEAGGIFEHGKGSHRLAVTGHSPGSKIYINKDLAINKSTGEVIAEEDLVSILIHEIGHHAGYTDNEERILDQISSMVKKRFLQLNERISLKSIGLNDISISIFNTTTLPYLLKLPVTEYRSMDMITTMGSQFQISETMMRSESENPTYSHQLMEAITRTHSKECSSYNKVQGIFGSNLRWTKIPKLTKKSDSAISAAIDLTFFCGVDVSSSKEFKIVYSFNAQLVRTSDGFYKIVNPSWGIDSRLDTRSSVGEVNIVSLKVNTDKIVGGGIWKGTLKVKLRNNKTIKSCWPTATAEHFHSDSNGVTHELNKSDCTFKKLSNNEWEVRFNWHIPKFVKSSKIYLAKIIFKLEDANNRMEYIQAYPQFRQYLEIQNENDESLYTLEKVRVLNDKEEEIKSIKYDEYNFIKRDIVFEFTFSSCYEQLFFSSMHFKLLYFNNGTDIGNSSYEVASSKLTPNAPVATVLSTECIEGKKVLRFGFPLSFNGNLDQVLRFIKNNGIQSINIRDIGFTGVDHRVFKYNLDNFKLTLP
jgi:hypothetical protein